MSTTVGEIGLAAPLGERGGSGRYEAVVARLEAMPITRWHVRARVIIGIATFFDAFDVLALAFVLPVLAREWGLTPPQIGTLIAAGFVGQLFGALFFGWLAERIGRLKTALYTIVLFAGMSFVCAFAWSYTSLLVFRFIQGLGLGGEVPVAASYINELAKSKTRGRFFLLYELIFPVGLLGAGLVGSWVVPAFGWQAMFLIGALPALLAIFLRRLLPESPRWLAEKGRFDEAEAAIQRIERESGSPTGPAPLDVAPVRLGALSSDVRERGRWGELLSGRYLSRTLVVWVVWFSCYVVTFGLTAWLPTLYSRIYNLPLAQSLQYGLITTFAGLVGALICALVIDKVGRRLWLTGAFLGTALPLLALYWQGATTAESVVVLASLSYAFVSSIAMTLYLYTPEVYPTRIRALGTGSAVAWRCAASALGPFIVGLLLTDLGLARVFLAFAAFALLGAVVIGAFAIETKQRLLEEISP